MAQSRAESEYDKFKAFTAGDPRPVDNEFEQATKGLPQLPKNTKSKRPKP